MIRWLLCWIKRHDYEKMCDYCHRLADKHHYLKIALERLNNG